MDPTRIIRFFFIGLYFLAIHSLYAMHHECTALALIYEDLTIITTIREKYGDYVKALNALLKTSREIDEALINGTIDHTVATVAQNAIINNLHEIVQKREKDEHLLHRELYKIAKKVDLVLSDPTVPEEVKRYVVAQKEATIDLLFKS
ncbi:hypothetical protein H0X06_04400 [Candidatus Dependentiae bacterium]|nr:hypothetical protein [Candidatus Dependentiae bacterium]